MKTPKKRDYVRERLNESPQRKRFREERNQARAMVLDHLTLKYGETKAKAMIKGRDVDHIKALALHGKNVISNTRIRSKHANRADKSTIFKGRKTTRPRNPRKN